jgi:hypothetical protein
MESWPGPGDEFGMTALHHAALRTSKVEILQTLVNAGADPQRKSTKEHHLWSGADAGRTPLEMARDSNMPEAKIISYLEKVS